MMTIRSWVPRMLLLMLPLLSGPCGAARPAAAPTCAFDHRSSKDFKGDVSICRPLPYQGEIHKHWLGPPRPDHKFTKVPYLATQHSSPFVFCYISKNACTKFMRLLSRLEGLINWDHEVKNELYAEFIGMCVHRVESMDPVDFSSFLNSDDTIWIAIIRDPLERFISAYADKIARPLGEPSTVAGTLPFMRHHDGMQLNPENISWFLNHNETWLHEDHFALQYHWCGFSHLGVRHYQVIARYRAESIGVVAKKLAQLVHIKNALLSRGWPPDGEAALFDTFESHSTGTGSVEFSFLTKSLCERIASIYEIDYEEFFPMIQRPDCSAYGDA